MATHNLTFLSQELSPSLMDTILIPVFAQLFPILELPQPGPWQYTYLPYIN